MTKMASLQGSRCGCLMSQLVVFWWCAGLASNGMARLEGEWGQLVRQWERGEARALLMRNHTGDVLLW